MITWSLSWHRYDCYIRRGVCLRTKKSYVDATPHFCSPSAKRTGARQAAALGHRVLQPQVGRWSEQARRTSQSISRVDGRSRPASSLRTRLSRWRITPLFVFLSTGDDLKTRGVARLRMIFSQRHMICAHGARRTARTVHKVVFYTCARSCVQRAGCIRVSGGDETRGTLHNRIVGRSH